MYLGQATPFSMVVRVPVSIGPQLWLQLTLLSPLFQKETTGLSFSFPKWKFFPPQSLCTWCSSSHNTFSLTLHGTLICPSGLLLWESTMSHSFKFSLSLITQSLLLVFTVFILCFWSCWTASSVTEDRPTCFIHCFYQVHGSCCVVLGISMPLKMSELTQG